MRTRFARIAGVVVLAGTLLSFGASGAGATEPICHNEGVPGNTLEDDDIQGIVYYRVTDAGGFELFVGPIAGVGRIIVQGSTVEATVRIENLLGNPGLDVTAGVDTGGYVVTPAQEFSLAVCTLVGPEGAGQGRDVFVDVDDPDTTRPGLTVRVFTCTGSPTHACSTLLGHTGAEISLGVPLSSCVWIDGRQQNTTTTCPAVDPGSGLPLP